MLALYICLLVFCSTPGNAWNGYDWESKTFIEIQNEDLVRKGKTIDFYEYGKGYGTLNIDYIRDSGFHVKIEGTDNETGETRTFEMD